MESYNQSWDILVDLKEDCDIPVIAGMANVAAVIRATLDATSYYQATIADSVPSLYILIMMLMCE